MEGPNFGLLQQPDFAAAALGSYNAGKNLGRQNQLDAAMRGIDLERPETLLPVLRADPSTGAALIGASVKLSAEKRAQDSQVALGNYFKQISGGGGQAAPAAAPSDASAGASPAALGGSAPPLGPMGSLAAGIGAAPASAPAPASAAPPGGQAVPFTPSGPLTQPHLDPIAARNALLATHPDLFEQVSQLDEMQRKQLATSSEALADIGATLMQHPYAERPALLQQHRADLIQHGVSTATLDSFDPTDDNINYETNKAVGAKALADHVSELQRGEAYLQAHHPELVPQFLQRETAPQPVVNPVTGEVGYPMLGPGGNVNAPAGVAHAPAPAHVGSLVPNAGAVVSQIYPQARITSTHRDPNSALGRANPNSYHNLPGASPAVDIAPIPGMSFKQYVDGYRSHGYTVVESRDEATHPLPHTTGPNWHVVLAKPTAHATLPSGFVLDQ